MAAVVLVDWENIFYSLTQTYRIRIPALQCLKGILAKAQEYGRLQRVVVFYGGHLQDEDLLSAIRFCGAIPYPLAPQSRGRVEPNLADTYLTAEALVLFFELKPDTVIIVSGDKGYTSALQQIRERGGKAVVFGLQGSMARVLQESPFIRDHMVFLDDVLVQAQQPERQPIRPLSLIAAVEKTAIEKKERTSLDVQRLLMTMMEYLPEMPYKVISRKRLTDLLGLTPQDQEWRTWAGLIEEAVREGQLEVSSVRMPDGKEIPHYCPNWRDPLTRDTILAWSVLVGTIKELTTRRNGPVPLAVVLDHLAPAPIDAQAEPSGGGQNPERDLLKTFYTIGVERGALRADTQMGRERRPVTMVSLNAEHPLVKNPVRVNLDLHDLPTTLQDQVSALTHAVRELCSRKSLREVSAAAVFSSLPPDFPKKVLLIAETIKQVETRKTTSERGNPVTLVTLPTPS